ncbi:MAG: GIY-YIG nuclease family protein [Candidatus Buchananbacteria bacterium]|nr:GIY-YIG nuclease family protein [Candidatus Buchananbacteria bacterium]
MYYVYILRCVDDSLYTGITTDIKRRVNEHNTTIRGAKYTRARRPVTLVYNKRYRTRSAASVAEAAIKKLSKTAKLELIKNK